MEEYLDIFVFCVSLSEYDQLCYEDDETDRVKESMDLLEKMINPEFQFEKFIPNLIIVFTKSDIFEYKIKKMNNLKAYFDDFNGDPTSIDDGKSYLKQKYYSLLNKYKKSFESIEINSIDQNDIKKLRKILENNL